jgi:hypothetical protein
MTPVPKRTRMEACAWTPLQPSMEQRSSSTTATVAPVNNGRLPPMGSSKMAKTINVSTCQTDQLNLVLQFRSGRATCWVSMTTKFGLSKPLFRFHPLRMALPVVMLNLDVAVINLVPSLLWVLASVRLLKQTYVWNVLVKIFTKLLFTAPIFVAQVRTF